MKNEKWKKKVVTLLCNVVEQTPFTQNMSNGWGYHHKHWAQIEVDGFKNVRGVKQ
jgi:hypothetical protein